jgi:hypothetical protein
MVTRTVAAICLINSSSKRARPAALSERRRAPSKICFRPRPGSSVIVPSLTSTAAIPDSPARETMCVGFQVACRQPSLLGTGVSGTLSALSPVTCLRTRSAATCKSRRRRTSAFRPKLIAWRRRETSASRRRPISYAGCIASSTKMRQRTCFAFAAPCLRPVCASRWMGATAGWTTSSSSGCGARSSTMTSISRAMPTAASLHQALGYRAPMAVWRDGAARQADGHADNKSAVDHVPTGKAETAADRLFGGLIEDNQQTDLQLSRRQNRSRCAGPLQFHDFVRIEDRDEREKRSDFRDCHR